MALTGWSGSNKLRKEHALVADPGWPIRFAIWGYMTTAQSGVAIGVHASGSSGDDDYHELLARPSPYEISLRSASGSTGSAAQSGVFPSAAWTHMAGYVAGTSSRAAWKNGGSKATNTGSKTPAGLDRTSIGVRDNVSNEVPWPSTGHLAIAAAWSVALSDNDAASLAAGADPRLIKPQSLLSCAYLDAADGVDVVSSTPYTLVGSLSQSAIGPPIFRAS